MAGAVARSAIQSRPVPQYHVDDSRQELTLIIAGFCKDRPAELIERVLRRFMSLTTAATKLGVVVGNGNGQYMMAPTTRPKTHAAFSTVRGFRACSPWLPSTEAHTICSTDV